MEYDSHYNSSSTVNKPQLFPIKEETNNERRLMKYRYQRQSEVDKGNPFSTVIKDSEINYHTSTRGSTTIVADRSNMSILNSLQQLTPQSQNGFPVIFNNAQQKQSFFHQTSRQSPRFTNDLIQSSVEFGKTQYQNFKAVPLLNTQQVRIDYPRQIRLASNDDCIDQARQRIRRNRIEHTSYNPQLDSTKSKLLLEGLYVPNEQQAIEELKIPISEFIKTQGTYKKETVKICDIYNGLDYLESSQKKKQKTRNPFITPRQNKPFTQAEIEERQYAKNLLRENQSRNQSRRNSSDSQSNQEQSHEHKEIQLNPNQLRHIYQMIDQKQKKFEMMMFRSFDAQVKHVERMLDEGYIIEVKEETPIERNVLKRRTLKQKLSSKQQSNQSNQGNMTQKANWSVHMEKKRTRILENKKASEKTSRQKTPSDNKIQNLCLQNFTDQIKKEKEQQLQTQRLERLQTNTFFSTQMQILDQENLNGKNEFELINDKIKDYLEKRKNQSQNDSIIKVHTPQSNRKNRLISIQRLQGKQKINVDALESTQSNISKHQKQQVSKSLNIIPKTQFKQELQHLIKVCTAEEKKQKNNDIDDFLTLEQSIIDEKNERVRRAIDSYQESFLSKIGQSVNDKQLLFTDIMMEQLIQDNENFDNFLKPDIIKQLKNEQAKMLWTSYQFGGKKSNIWKPDKFDFPKDIQLLIQNNKDMVNELNKN